MVEESSTVLTKYKSRLFESKDRLSRIISNDSILPYLLILPALLWVLTIYLYPLVQLIWTSFTDGTIVASGDFVGLDNYRELANSEFYATLYRTAIWTFGSVVPALLIGLGGAIVLNQNFRGKRYFLGLVLLPWALPLAIVGFLWLMMYNPSFGQINTILLQTGVISESIGFLSYENALYSVIIARIWRAVPFALIIYYARLQSIPSELYEAARVDGAGAWAQFRYVTLPELSRVTAITLIVLTVWTTLIFDIVWTMTAGGPVDATLIIPVDIYSTAFRDQNLGLASAKSVVTIMFLIVLTIVYWKYSALSE